ncbi:MAG TPA: helix-turn-helix domain-containing protein, partial [Cyclobacteriaceae bacterium]
ERVEDIPLLAKYFITQFSLKTNKKELNVAPDFMKALQQHPWKGNIRELKNIIERSVILSDDVLTPSVLPSDFSSEEVSNTFELAVVEKLHILKVLRHTGGNKTETAKLLGIGLTTLYRKIEEYSL